MFGKTKNSAIRAYEIMKEKGHTPEEIEAFLEFLDKNTKEMTRPLVWRVSIGFGGLPGNPGPFRYPGHPNPGPPRVEKPIF